MLFLKYSTLLIALFYLPFGQGAFINVALRKPTYIGSEKNGNNGLVDGLKRDYVSVPRPQAWFMVNLKSKYTISHIFIYIRDQKSFTLALTDTLNRNFPENYANSQCVQKKKIENTMQIELDCAKSSPEARYVYIKATDSSILYIYEVEIYSNVFPLETNLALNGRAVLQPGNNNASECVDGDYNSKCGYIRSSNRWFIVDLVRPQKISHVKLYSKQDVVDEFKVGLGNGNDMRRAGEGSNYELCKPKYRNKNVFKCQETSDLTRFVAIKMLTTGGISFDEVEVYAGDWDQSRVYVGCYGGVEDPFETNETVTSVEDCLNTCGINGFWFALIKSGSLCFCTKNLPKICAPVNKCYLTCSVDQNTCGSELFYSVYQTKPFEKSSPQHLGCYLDKPKRDLKKRISIWGMSVETCFQKCMEMGYTYSALQFSNDCFCGNSYGRYGQGKECNMPCSSNKSQICGGPYHNNVYKACFTYDGLLDTCSPDLHHCYGKPLLGNICESCEIGWKGPTCSHRECQVNNGGCGKHSCKRWPFKHLNVSECVCQDGYYKRTYNDHCQDINECNDKRDKCNPEKSVCVNLDGSYQCKCSRGYENKDSLTCHDVDECMEENPKCTQTLEECINIEGSYRCDCVTGYTKNGTSCTDIDECLVSPCNQFMQQCQNVPGSYLCSLKDENKSSLIGGLIGIFLLLLLLILLIVICLKRKRIQKYFGKKIRKKSFVDKNGIAMETKMENKIEAANKSKVNVELAMKKDTQILLQDLEHLYISKTQIIYDNFSKCPKDCGASKEVGSNSAISSKNRFKTIYPYDHNRVVLEEKNGDPLSDYINASFISAHETVKDYSFIAAQGPKPQTVEDFWRMVLQYRVSVVVMLTTCYENGVSKCHKYWPESGSERYGSLWVTLVEVKKSLHVEERFLKVENKEIGLWQTTQHLLFTAWPDKSVPENAMSLLNLRSSMLRLLRMSEKETGGGEENLQTHSNFRQNETKYIVVHCSAGVGRTGTFICLDHLVNQALHSGSIDVFETMKQLRKQRCLMVQTKAQYELCYKCMYMYYKIGEETIMRLNVKKEFEKNMICLRKIQNGANVIQKQFDVIDNETKTNQVKDVERTQIVLSSVMLDAVYASSAMNDSRYMVGVTPISFSKQDVFTLFSQHVNVLILVDTTNQSTVLMSSLQDMSNLKAKESALSFVGQNKNVLCHVMKFRYGANDVYSNAESLNPTNKTADDSYKKVINVCSVDHDVIKHLYNIIKDENIHKCIMVLSRDYDDASVMVGALNVAESIETSRSFDVFQSSFEMRFTQPACLKCIDLYEKLYSIAEKLSEKEADEGVETDDDAIDDENNYEDVGASEYEDIDHYKISRNQHSDEDTKKQASEYLADENLYANT